MEIEKIRDLKIRSTTDMANELFLKEDFDIYSRDYTYHIHGYSLLGSGGIRPKVLYLDVDDTLTAYKTDSLSKLHYNSLAELNSRINKRIDIIHSLLDNIADYVRRVGDFLLKTVKRYFLREQISVINQSNSYLYERSVKDLAKEFRDAKLKKVEHEEAARIAVDKTRLVTNLFPALKRLEDPDGLGYQIKIVSSGPDRAIQNLAREITIPSARTKASEFKFNEKGEFLDLDANVGIRKRFDERDYHLCGFVTDDYEADLIAIGSLSDLGFIVLPTEEKVEIPGRMYVQVPEMRRDFIKLPEFVRRYEWALLYGYLYSPSAIHQGIETMREINRYASLCKTAKEQEVWCYGNLAEEAINAFFNSFGKVLPAYSSKIGNLLEELKIERGDGDVERYKKVIEDIVNRLNEIPLAKAKKDFIESLKSRKKEWEELKEEFGIEEKDWRSYG